MMTDKFYSPREAAAVLGIRLDSIYRLCWSGRLGATKTPAGEWQIPLRAIKARQRLQEARRAVEQIGA